MDRPKDKPSARMRKSQIESWPYIFLQIRFKELRQDGQVMPRKKAELVQAILELELKAGCRPCKKPRKSGA